MVDVKVGSRLKSATCATEVVVVRAPGGEIDLRCGGAPMSAGGDAGGQAVDPKHAGPTQLGKRYVDEDDKLEVLVAKAGDGMLSIGDTPMQIKAPKALPASD